MATRGKTESFKFLNVWTTFATGDKSNLHQRGICDALSKKNRVVSVHALVRFARFQKFDPLLLADSPRCCVLSCFLQSRNSGLVSLRVEMYSYGRVVLVFNVCPMAIPIYHYRRVPRRLETCNSHANLQKSGHCR